MPFELSKEWLLLLIVVDDSGKLRTEKCDQGKKAGNLVLIEPKTQNPNQQNQKNQKITPPKKTPKPNQNQNNNKKPNQPTKQPPTPKLSPIE